jgi:hypothetical protein
MWKVAGDSGRYACGDRTDPCFVTMPVLLPA